MNNRFVIMLIIALVLAGSAAWIANRWVEAQEEINRKKGQTQTAYVVVAAKEIPFATRLQATDITMMPWPINNTPKLSFDNTKLVVGKITQRSFVKDEPLLKPQIREHLGGSTLSALITEGKRAMTVRVNDVVGVAGFVLPGNRVDILLSKGKSAATKTLLKSIKVLAIDQSASPDRDKPAVVRAITVEVTPKESEILTKAMNSGSLQFTLRNPLDDKVIVKKEQKKAMAKRTGKKVVRKVVRKRRPPPVMVIPWGNGPKGCKGAVC